MIPEANFVIQHPNDQNHSALDSIHKRNSNTDQDYKHGLHPTLSHRRPSPVSGPSLNPRPEAAPAIYSKFACSSTRGTFPVHPPPRPSHDCSASSRLPVREGLRICPEPSKHRQLYLEIQSNVLGRSGVAEWMIRARQQSYRRGSVDSGLQTIDPANI